MPVSRSRNRLKYLNVRISKIRENTRLYLKKSSLVGFFSSSAKTGTPDSHGLAAPAKRSMQPALPGAPARMRSDRKSVV
jgi:hypothetical protein